MLKSLSFIPIPFSNRGSRNGGMTRNEKLVIEGWCEAIRNRDIAKVKRFAANDSICHYKGADSSMPLEVMLEACGSVFKSFPDHKVEWDTVKEVSPGLVQITNFYGHGTHTGVPFGFATFPAIPATNKYVKETPFTMVIEVKRGKMTFLQFDTEKGELYGPPGHYVKIGGKLC